MRWTHLDEMFLKLIQLLSNIYDALPCWHVWRKIPKPSWKGFPDQPECRHEHFCLRCKTILGCECGRCPSSMKPQ